MNVIYLFHGKGGSPDGTVARVEAALRPHLPGEEFRRVRLPHSDYNLPAEDSLPFLRELNMQQSAAILGVSLGGLVAARFQEDARPDLKVICLSSPTWADAVRLERKLSNRIAIYSSNDEVIAGRTADWPSLAEAHDLPWLTHNTDRHLEQLTPFLLKAL